MHSRYNKTISRLFIPTILACIGLSLALAMYRIANRTQSHKYAIAAGMEKGESYLFSLAMADLVAKYQPKIKIKVIPSDGSEENIQLLQDNKAQLATAQADIPVQSSARIITFLFQDVFQVVVKDTSNIKKVSELRGRRIARPPRKGGQIKSFEVLATHYGLKPNDITYIDVANEPVAKVDEEEAIKEKFAKNQVDAVFHVRPVGNKSILELIEKYGGRLVPIDQATAMKIEQPNYNSAFIFKGTYQGSPPVPERDLPTVAVERTLLASKNTPVDDIRQITSVLYEHRQELDEKMQELAHKDQRLAAAIPLASYIHPPNNLESVSRVPIHPGAQAYYDRKKPSFFKANADVLASLLSIVALLGSGVWELKSRLEKNQKNQADKYSERVIKELNEVMTSSSTDPEKLKKQLLDARRNLLDIFKESVIALNENRISQESFQSFRVVWQVAMEAVDREDTLLEKSF